MAEFCQPSKMIGYRFTNKNQQAKYSVNKKQQRKKELVSNTLNRSTNTLFITPFVSSLDFIYRESKIIRVKGYKLFKLWTADHIHALYTSEIQDSLHSNHTVLIHKRMLKGTCACTIFHCVAMLCRVQSNKSPLEKAWYSGSAQVCFVSVRLGQRTMSGLIGELTSQPFILPVMLSGHIRSY